MGREVTVSGARYPGSEGAPPNTGPRIPDTGLFDLSPFQGSNEPRQHAADVGGSLQEAVPLVGLHVPQSSGDQDLGLELHQGAIRDGEVMQIIAEVFATVSFGNVRGEGH